MFIANLFVDVYREINGDSNYSEYDDEVAAEWELLYRKVPVHLTPFTPFGNSDSLAPNQSTSHIGDVKKNYRLMNGDELRTNDGRVFEVGTSERTGGAFMNNSVVYSLTERNSGL